MSGVDAVKASVPADAVYVTLVDMLVMQGPARLSGMQYTGGVAHDSVVGTEGLSTTSAYMLHNGSELMFIANGQKILSVPLGDVETLQSMQSLKRSAVFAGARGGFVCNLRDGRSIVISTPMPVATDQTTHFKTIGRMTDITGGWSKELRPYGVTTIY